MYPTSGRLHFTIRPVDVSVFISGLVRGLNEIVFGEDLALWHGNSQQVMGYLILYNNILTPQKKKKRILGIYHVLTRSLGYVNEQDGFLF